jgi:hypothetical protein
MRVGGLLPTRWHGYRLGVGFSLARQPDGIVSFNDTLSTMMGVVIAVLYELCKFTTNRDAFDVGTLLPALIVRNAQTMLAPCYMIA